MSFASESMGPVGLVASYVGIPEAAFRLFLSIIAGYPLAGIYLKYFKEQTATNRQLYFSITGFLLCVFNYGFETYHSLLAILVTYIFVRVLSGTKYFLPANFTFHMGYLLIGYYFTESDDYDIKWTMPHCVMVLRLIGLGFDISDGKLPNELLSPDQKQNAVTEIPSLLELTAFTYFPASFLVGPQFPYRRYQRFIQGEFNKYTENVKSGLQRGALGILYLIVRQYGASKVPDTYFFTQQFASESFLKKLFYVGVWAKVSLYKYISCWLLTEGSLTCFGLSFNNVDKNGIEDWSGCTNVKLWIFETASRMNDYVLSFNVNTNYWVAQYVYKRLKFLGNRNISYAAALLFLAVWHGFHTGYYICFLLEYLVITFEKQFEPLFSALARKYPAICDSAPAKAFYFVGLRVYTHVCMGWCLLPFIYLSYDKWMKVFGIFHYYGIIFLGTWFLGHALIKKYLKARRSTDIRHKD